MTRADDETFTDLFGGASRCCAMLIDSGGPVIAGSLHRADGMDLTAETAAAAIEVSKDAHRAMQHLAVGSWSALVCESERGVIGFAQAGNDSTAFVAAEHPATPGYVRRLLGKVVSRGTSITVRL